MSRQTSTTAPDPAKELERKLAKQARLLQKIRELEVEKKNAIDAGEIDRLAALEKQTDVVMKESVLLRKEAKRLVKDLKMKGEAPSEKILQLDKIVVQLAKETEILTDENRRLLIRQKDRLQQQIGHVRLGQTAMSGYKSGLGRNLKNKTTYRGKT
jgi:hypothetical protein